MEKKKWKCLKIVNEWIACTLRVWSIVRKQMGMPLTISRALQIAKLSDFYPNRIDSSFLTWAEKGLLTIHDLFDGEVLKSFSQLQEQYGLCSKDFHRYLQIRHFVRSQGELEKLKRIPTTIESYLIKIITENNKAKVVAKMYALLQTHLMDSSIDIKGRWELEANIIIEDEDWLKACHICHKTSNSPIWKEFGWKVTMRFFRTPSVTCHFSKNKSNLCWRNCKNVGDYSHIFWDCPILIPFWQGVIREIQNILKCNLTLDMVHCVIGVAPNECFKKEEVKMIQLLLLVAKKMITKHWLKVQPPTLQQWQEGLKRVYCMEKITAQLHLNTEHFIDIWGPIRNHFGWAN